MSDSVQPRTETTSTRFLRGAGEVREDPNNRLWWPARWVVSMIQYLLAIMGITIAEGFKSILTGESSKKRRANAHVE